MQNKPVQLSKKAHAKLKLKQGFDLTQYAANNMLPIIVHEMAQLSTELPLVFVKNAHSGQFTCVALTGLNEAQNLLVKDNQWQGFYMPALLGHYPLGLLKSPQDELQLIVVVSEQSRLLSEREGERLFEQDGSQSEYLNQRIASLQRYYQCTQVTSEFTQLLANLDLLEAQSLNYQVAEINKNVAGVYLVNEHKLMALSGENFNQLKTKGFLSAIYHHLASINNIRKLIAKLEQVEA